MTTLPKITVTEAAIGFWRWRWWVAGLLVVIAVGTAFAIHSHEQNNLRARLLATSPFELDDHPDLVKFASEEAPSLYAANCASCHGDNMQGNTALGAPNLVDRAWLYGDDSVHQIERTIMFGIRDGPHTRDVTEMPAFGQRGLLTPNQVQDVVQYILKLNGRPHDAEAAAEGQDVYSKSIATCFDCHDEDARGIPDYGTPDLTANVWDWGGSPEELYNSIYYGRHGIMPGWLGRLDLEQIRALALYIHASGPHHMNSKLAERR